MALKIIQGHHSSKAKKHSLTELRQ